MARKKTIAAVGYARRSTDMQERSIPDQKAYVEKWAKENGYAIQRWYVDDAISGTSARGRADFERLMRDAENGRDFETVLVYDISRFSRGGTNETGYYLHRLHMAGVEAIFCAEGIPAGEEGELLQGVKSWQARQYSVKLSRDSIRGQHSCVTIRKSAMGGPAPYGYDRQYLTPEGSVLRTIRTLPDGRREEFGPDGQRVRIIGRHERIGRKVKSDIVRLVPGNPDQVQAVRRIFEMCATGYGFRSIVIELNSCGLSAPRGTRWNRQAIKTILQNPCYYGALVWNRRTFGKLHGVESDGTPRRKVSSESTRNPRSKWVVVEGVHEPLITKELYESAQAAMAERRGKGGLARPTNRYLLSGLIRCRHCGFNFWGCIVRNGKGTRHRYYVDGGYRSQGVKVCRSTSIPAVALDEWVVSQLQALVRKEDTSDAVERFVEAVLARRDQPSASVDSTSVELGAVEQRIRNTVALLTDGDLADLPELKETLVQLKKQRQELISRRDLAPESRPTEQIGELELREWARRRLDQLGKGMSGEMSTHELRGIVHAYVDRIEVEPYKQMATMYIPRDLADALTHQHVSRVSSSSSSHSCTVLVADRCASPR